MNNYEECDGRDPRDKEDDKSDREEDLENEYIRESDVEKYYRTAPNFQPQPRSPHRLPGGRIPTDNREYPAADPEFLSRFDIQSKMYEVDELCGALPALTLEQKISELEKLNFTYQTGLKPAGVKVERRGSNSKPDSRKSQSTQQCPPTSGRPTSGQNIMSPPAATRSTRPVSMNTGTKVVTDAPPPQNDNPFCFTKEQLEKRSLNYKMIIKEHFQHMKFLEGFGYAIQNEAEKESPYHHPTPWTYWVGEGSGVGQLVDQDVLLKSYPNPPPAETWESFEKKFMMCEKESAEKAEKDVPGVWF